jgi:ABC-type uncharacterized transport system ATPase subunit
MSVFQDNEYKKINDKINSIKYSLKKKEYLELQNMLLNAYNRERNNEIVMKTHILNSLNKSIGKHVINIENTKKGNNQNNKLQQLIKPNKYYQNHIRRRRTMKKLSPIFEEANSQSNTKTRSKSRGGRNTRKNTKKHINHSTW